MVAATRMASIRASLSVTKSSKNGCETCRGSSVRRAPGMLPGFLSQEESPSSVAQPISRMSSAPSLGRPTKAAVHRAASEKNPTWWTQRLTMNDVDDPSVARYRNMPQYEALIVSLLVRGDRPIGMRVHEHMGLLEVVKVEPDGLAARAGIQACDQLLAVDGIPLQGSARTFSKLMLGNDTVQLTVSRPSGSGANGNGHKPNILEETVRAITNPLSFCACTQRRGGKANMSRF